MDDTTIANLLFHEAGHLIVGLFSAWIEPDRPFFKLQSRR